VGKSVDAAIRAQEAKPGVVSATPNMVAHVSGWTPADPGTANAPAGWQQLQWNFLPGLGVDAPDAWQHLIDVGRPGGKGVVVAVLDTGIAYSDRKPFRARPTSRRAASSRATTSSTTILPQRRERPRHARAGTIAEGTGNAIGVTGLAYGVRLMPVRVLDATAKGLGGDLVRHPLGGRPRREDHQPLVRVRLRRHPPADPGHPQRAAPRARQGCAGGRRLRQRAAATGRVSRSRRRAVGRRDDAARLQADYSNEGQDLDVVAPGGGPTRRWTATPRATRTTRWAATSTR
jgi:serine protease